MSKAPEKICMFCVHLEFEDGGYGDYADPASLDCSKGHYGDMRTRGNNHVYNVADFRRMIVRAATCQDYTQVKP